MHDLYFHHPCWPLIFEDNHLLVLYKPAGLLVQGDQTGDVCLLDLGKSWLKERYRKPGAVFLGMVHRLDRPVAGVTVFARTSKAAGRLSAQFRSRQARKLYLAVLEGTPPRESETLVHRVERRGDRSSRVAPQAGQGQEARLSYRLLGSSGPVSLVEVRLETGRRHQIRVQFSHLGCPVLGDLRYGARNPLPGKQIALLAWRLLLEHPTRREPLLFESPIPDGWPLPPQGAPLARTPWNWKDLEKLLGPGPPQ